VSTKRSSHIKKLTRIRSKKRLKNIIFKKRNRGFSIHLRNEKQGGHLKVFAQGDIILGKGQLSARQSSRMGFEKKCIACFNAKLRKEKG